MWLINTSSLALEYFVDPESEGVRYAVLSHTWGRDEDEVTFQQFTDTEAAARKLGFAKIRKTCELAQQDGLAYAWVDTCCIDKSSSAELSEAINSMYSWYRASAVCYAYLADLDWAGDGVHKMEDENWADASHYSQNQGPPLRGIPRDTAVMGTEELEKHKADILWSPFARSRWFTRGWTLQELIAPSHLVFYDARWRRFGDKRSLHRPLQIITRIDSGVLLDSSQLITRSVWSRMSWAATRDTKRVEDIAYCLLGIFDVSMPLIYGEGYKAFQRLQEEITRKEGDVTILAWHAVGMPAPKYRPVQYKSATVPPESRGAFAWAPSEFMTPEAGDTEQQQQTMDLIGIGGGGGGGGGGGEGEDREGMGRVRAYKLEMGPQSSVVIRCREGKIRAVVLEEFKGLRREVREYAELPMPRGLMQRPVVFHNLDGFAFRSVEPHHNPTGRVAMEREYDNFTHVWPNRYWKDDIVGWSFTQEQATVMTQAMATKVYGIVVGYLTTDGVDEVGRPAVQQHPFALILGSSPARDEEGDLLEESPPLLFGLCVGAVAGRQTKLGTEPLDDEALAWVRQEVFREGADLRNVAAEMSVVFDQRRFKPCDGMREQVGSFMSGGKRQGIDLQSSFQESLWDSEQEFFCWELDVGVHIHHHPY